MTLLFDMFFTTILFKHMYCRLVHIAGFSKSGREWIANGFVSFVIGLLTFQVYANMTRFQCTQSKALTPGLAALL